MNITALKKALSTPGMIGALSRQYPYLGAQASKVNNNRHVSEVVLKRLAEFVPAALNDLANKGDQRKAHELAKKQARKALGDLQHGEITALAKRLGWYPQFLINFKNGSNIAAGKLAQLWEDLK